MKVHDFFLLALYVAAVALFVGIFRVDIDRANRISEQCDARLTACIESKYARPKVCR